MSTDDVVHLSKNSFQTEILEADTLALVDFTSQSCGPCKAIAPAVHALATAWRGRLKVAMLDVDAHPEVAQRYGVRAIPTLLLFRDGRVVRQLVGAGSRDRLDEAVRAAIA